LTVDGGESLAVRLIEVEFVIDVAFAHSLSPSSDN
jgi:hypothetical protein